MEFNQIILEKVSSTNDYAKEHLDQFDLNRITLIQALEQTSGRGRGDHRWLSPAKKNLLVTFVFPISGPNASIGQLIAFSIAIVCKSLGLSLMVKWPNDLFLSGKKVGGVLCETLSHHGSSVAIVGVGLNVNVAEEGLKEIPQPATSLKIELGHEIDIGELLKLIKREFARDLTRFLEQGFAPFCKEYQKLQLFLGEKIALRQGEHRVEGLYVGIDGEGGLLLEQNGSTKAYYNGHISELQGKERDPE